MTDIKKIAERLDNLLPWWDKDGITTADIVKELEKHPLDVIGSLLDYIEEQEA